MRRKGLPRDCRPQRGRTTLSPRVSEARPRTGATVDIRPQGGRTNREGGNCVWEGLEEAMLIVASGGAQRNPRCGGWRGCRPRRGRYARCGRWHVRLFEAIHVGCVRSAGSAALHPRLLIGRPPWGRSCGGGMAREAGCPPRRDAIHLVSTRPDGLGGAAFLPPLLKPLFF